MIKELCSFLYSPPFLVLVKIEGILILCDASKSPFFWEKYPEAGRYISWSHTIHLHQPVPPTINTFPESSISLSRPVFKPLICVRCWRTRWSWTSTSDLSVQVRSRMLFITALISVKSVTPFSLLLTRSYLDNLKKELFNK